MAYNYYVVWVNENPKEDTGTNVYASSAAQAKAIGAVLLSRLTGQNLTANDLDVEMDSDMTEDHITTT